MKTFLKNPLTMWGRVERCWLLAYRAPAKDIQALLPAPLEAVTKGGYGFYNIVLCRVGEMRPWPLPEAFGFSYWHVAYRIHARFRDRRGGMVEGLYFRRCDCDQGWLVSVGNGLSDFRFHAATLRFRENEEDHLFEIQSRGGDAFVRVGKRGPCEQAEGSPFGSLEEAERFLMYKPRSLGPSGPGFVQVLEIGRDESAWRHRLVPVIEESFEFLRESHARLELCYEVEAIDYLWRRGKDVAHA